ncbi:MAG: hypothetical protein J2P50_20745 [Hyphomicrobiaceae bacterium]|nr:hypothetical protein [Hyphomicrobiaceae bacterium]
MNIKHLEVGPRTILTDDGEPMLVKLALRPSRSAPGRIKAVMAVPIEDDNGNEGFMVLPFAEPIMALDGEPTGFTPEFRLEMN